MNVDWSKLVACGGYASAAEVPKAIDTLFCGSPKERKKAYWKIDNCVVVQGGLFESAPYAARLIVDKIKMNPSNLNPEILDILFEIANGNPRVENVENGPLKGRSIQRLCRDTVAEVLPLLAAARDNANGRAKVTIEDLLEAYGKAKD